MHSDVNSGRIFVSSRQRVQVDIQFVIVILASLNQFCRVDLGRCKNSKRRKQACIDLLRCQSEAFFHYSTAKLLPFSQPHTQTSLIPISSMVFRNPPDARHLPRRDIRAPHTGNRPVPRRRASEKHKTVPFLIRPTCILNITDPKIFLSRQIKISRITFNRFQSQRQIQSQKSCNTTRGPRKHKFVRSAGSVCVVKIHVESNLTESRRIWTVFRSTGFARNFTGDKIGFYGERNKFVGYTSPCCIPQF